MPTISLDLANNLAFVHEDGGGWIPSGTPQVPAVFKYEWAYATVPVDHLGTNYQMGGIGFDLDSMIGLPYAIDSITYRLSGTINANTTIPNICIDGATISGTTPADVYGAVTGTILSVGGLSTGSHTYTGSLAADALDGVTGLRAGFDSTSAPALIVPLPDPVGEFANFTGSFSLTITYHLLCIAPGTFVQGDVICSHDVQTGDTSVAVDCMVMEQLADDYGITPFEDIASVMGSDQRVVLWFETCVLAKQFFTVQHVYLALDIAYVLRDPCNPYLRGYYAAENDPSGELQPALDTLDGSYYITPEGSPSFDPLAIWAIGRDAMIETITDHEWIGPARLIIELNQPMMIFGARMTGIVFTGNFSDGIGRVDIVNSSQLLVCGSQKPAEDAPPAAGSSGGQGGGGDDGSGDGPGDPGDNGDDGGGDKSGNKNEDKTTNTRGELPTVNAQLVQPYKRPVPEKIHVLKNFLARLRRDGTVEVDA